MSEEQTIVTLSPDTVTSSPVVQREVVVVPAEKAVAVETLQTQVIEVDRDQFLLQEVVEVSVLSVGQAGPAGAAGAIGATGATGATGPAGAAGGAADTAAVTHAALSKATPVDADELPLVDSAAAWALAKLTWANLKATLKTYFDGLYPAGSGTSTGANTGDQTNITGNAGTVTNGVYTTDLGTGVATFLGTPSSANLVAAVTDETGSGALVFATSPAFTTQISTPSIVTVSGALGVTPAAGSGLNINLSTTGDLAVNTNQLYVDTSGGGVGIGITPAGALKLHVNGYSRFEDYIYGNTAAGVVYYNDSVSVGATKRLYLDGGSNSYFVELASDVIGLFCGSAEVFRANINSQLLLGPTSAETLGNANKLQVAGRTGDSNSLGISNWGADALGPRIELGKSRGLAVGTNTIVQSNDVVGSVTGYGANGSTFTNTAQISMEIDGTPGATNDMPGRIVFKTTPDGSGTLTEALRISQDQTATFASTISASNLSAWAAYTPTRTGWTDVGSPTVTARFCQVRNVCHFQIKVVPGTTTATVAGTSYATLPVTAAGLGGDGSMQDLTTFISIGNCVFDVANSRVYVPTQTATADSLIIAGSYEV